MSVCYIDVLCDNDYMHALFDTYNANYLFNLFVSGELAQASSATMA